MNLILNKSHFRVIPFSIELKNYIYKFIKALMEFANALLKDEGLLLQEAKC